MHPRQIYYLDGYNLMFRLLHASDNLTACREQFIVDLNHKIQALDLNVVVVFDSQFQFGESSRTHFKHLEIQFSGFEETADDLILAQVKSEKYPKQVTVVTSDKKLAWFARRCEAKTQSVEQFIAWVNKRYHNRLRKPEKNIKTASKAKEESFPLKASSPEGSFDYYLEQFEKRLMDL